MSIGTCAYAVASLTQISLSAKFLKTKEAELINFIFSKLSSPFKSNFFNFRL